MKRLIILMIAMASGMLAMAIMAPSNVRWEKEDITFYWDTDFDAEYASYMLDGVQRGFLCYHASSYSPNPQYLSPGDHTFCVCLADAQLNYSDWTCITITIDDELDPTLPEGPAAPINLQAWQSGANEITLTWQPGDEHTHFCVFLDEQAVNYDVNANIFVFMGVEPGTHTVGVSTWGENGFVSEMVSMTVVCQGRITYTIPLAQAHWSFEHDREWIRGSETITNTETAEYAFSDSSAMVLESEAGATAYAILPMIDDVADYDSLQLSFVARGGYWSRGAGIWSKTTAHHRLVVGAMGNLPYTGFHTDSVVPLLETELPCASLTEMENYTADSAFFWRTFCLPLTAGTLPFIVFYGESDRTNYIIVDDIRISKLAPPSEPTDDRPEPPIEEPSGEGIIEVYAPRKMLQNGTLIIIRDGIEYDLLGRQK